MLINIYSIISDSLPNDVTDHLRTNQTNESNERIKRTNQTNESNKQILIVNGTERADSRKIIVLPIPTLHTLCK